MLQVELIDQLVNYLDMDEAARWAKYCKIPTDQLPHQILHLVDNAERFVSEILLYKVKTIICNLYLMLLEFPLDHLDNITGGTSYRS